MPCVTGLCASLLFCLQADEACPGNALEPELNNFYFKASSATGAVGDIVAVDVSAMLRYLPEHRPSGMSIVVCYDEEVAELVADPLYSPEFDAGVYMSFFWRWGEGFRPEALRPGGGLGFALVGLLKAGGERMFPDRVTVPVATLFFRLKGPAGNVGEVRFCDEEFRRVLGGACESNRFYMDGMNGADLLVARSKHHVGASITVMDGPATQTNLPVIPPGAKIYPRAPTPEETAVLFELSGAVASPGSKDIPIDLYVTSALEFSGFSVSLEYPSRALALTRVEEHTRSGIVRIDNDSGHLGMIMANSRRRVGAESERVRIATLYFDAKEGAENEGELVSAFKAKHPYMNWLAIHHEAGTVNDLPVAAHVEPIQLVEGLVKIQSLPTRPGDVNLDYRLNLTDSVLLLEVLFQGDSGIVCPGAADANRDDVVDLADPVTILNHLFRGGPIAIDEIRCDWSP